MAYDPASNAAAQAALAARCDDLAFALTAAPTNRPFVDHPLQRAVLPTTDSTYLVTWGARYRRRVLGDSLVCDVADLDLAKGLLLQWAATQFAQWDLRLGLQQDGKPFPDLGWPQPPAPERRWTGLNWVVSETGQASG